MPFLSKVEQPLFFLRCQLRLRALYWCVLWLDGDQLPAAWEDITDSTPMTVNDDEDMLSFSTSVSAKLASFIKVVLLI